MLNYGTPLANNPHETLRGKYPAPMLGNHHPFSPHVMELKEIKQEELVVVSIKDFATKHKFIQMAPAVRVNENGYPFITFIDVDNKAENVYFSKASALAVASGTVIDKALISKYQIAITKNQAGEERIKLISNSARVNIADMFE